MSPISAKTLRERELAALAKQKAKNQPTVDHETLQEIWYLLGGDAYNLHPLTPAQVLDRVRQFKDNYISEDESKERIQDALDNCSKCEEHDDELKEVESALEDAKEELSNLQDKVDRMIMDIRGDLEERGVESSAIEKAIETVLPLL